MIGDRILVLAPHPDDEVVGCATAIARATAAGARVFVLFLTTGVPEAAAEWPWRRVDHQARVARRRAEATRVAERLGAAPAAFLDCPSRRLRAGLAAARAEIRAQLGRTDADALWAPAYEGGHQDHDVASFLASRFSHEVRVIEFAEYNNAAGVRTNRFPVHTGGELVLALSAGERASKRALLDGYRSERGNLRHVRCDREELRPLATYDYARRPHAGVLFYERYAWVPFKHPRVDFTKPEDVCAAFATDG